MYKVEIFTVTKDKKKKFKTASKYPTEEQAVKAAEALDALRWWRKPITALRDKECSHRKSSIKWPINTNCIIGTPTLVK